MLIADDHSDSVAQDVTISIHGANDAPTAAVDDHIITNAGLNGGVFVAAWAFGVNDLDPDSQDTLTRRLPD